jgi:hypothetical protein
MPAGVFSRVCGDVEFYQGVQIVEVSALGFEEFLPKTVEWKASLNRLVRRELVS